MINKLYYIKLSKINIKKPRKLKRKWAKGVNRKVLKRQFQMASGYLKGA